MLRPGSYLLEVRYLGDRSFKPAYSPFVRLHIVA